MIVQRFLFIVAATCLLGHSAFAELQILVEEGIYQQYQVRHDERNGLPDEAILDVSIDDAGTIRAATENETYTFDGAAWSRTEDGTANDLLPWFESLKSIIGSTESIRDVAKHEGEIAIAAEQGLYVGDGRSWTMAMPQQGDVRWAPVDVRAVVYDDEGRLWFAAPQGVGYRVAEGEWKLFTGAEGLPYNDFTCIAAGKSGVWFGTTNGAIQCKNDRFSFRQGGRWLLDNHVKDIVIDAHGDAWIATAEGVSQIAHKSWTYAEKAQFYEEEIEKYHRRTKFGYVNPATLSTPGDKSTATPRYSDNDGINTGQYLAAMSFAYASTKDEKYRELAQNAFRALAFLSEVTQGGEHGAPKGYIARNVVPTSEADPNDIYDFEYDVRRRERDGLWKVLTPRVPIDKTGEWYWKTDSSSDELDGHFFGSAVYFDRVCKTEEEKDEVRKVVRRIIDHLIKHDYNLVDYDGRPTRWGHFSPNDLNRNEKWVAERGLNSYSILTYLQIAHHILGDKKYRKRYMDLAIDHGYGMNGMSQPKEVVGPGYPGHQPDDNMAFMNYYHLIRYETDPKLLTMYLHAIQTHWRFEKLERNPLTNFIYTACVRGQTLTTHWETIEFGTPIDAIADGVGTLAHYPIDLIEWPMSNAHRTDLVVLDLERQHPPKVGGRVDGYCYPIDERHETYWDWNCWALTSSDDGTTLRPGFHYLLPYYMGKFHGFFREEIGDVTIRSSAIQNAN